jgi:regulatory subunit for Cdc7p protein kinase
MAVVALSPVLERNRTMSNRRVPLASNPNAVNSPYRALTAAAVKRSRFETEKQDELLYDQQPPPKRQAVEIVQSRPRTPTRKPTVLHPEGRLLNKKITTSQPTEFERKLYAAKDRQTQQRVERQEKATAESLNGIKQWQKYYRRVFPEYVFYFENIPVDVRAKCLKQIRVLGAVSVYAMSPKLSLQQLMSFLC